MNIAEDTRTFEEFDDPYQGVIDYEWLIYQHEMYLRAELELLLGADDESTS
jgi:hypothetical protein